MMESELAIRAGIEAAKTAVPDDGDKRREILEAAYASAGGAYKDIGRTDLAVESYEGALALVGLALSAVT
jgi:hypothetical protein